MQGWTPSDIVALVLVPVAAYLIERAVERTLPRPAEARARWEMGCLLAPVFFSLWLALPILVLAVTGDRRLAGWVGIAWLFVILFVAPRLPRTMNVLIQFGRLHPGYSGGLGARLKYVAFFAAPTVLAMVLLTALLAFALRRA